MPGIERPLVQRDVQDVGVGVEDVLGAVAVVRVPVDDQRPARPRSRSAAAATATLLSRQKPIAWSGSAWWPGGRTAQNAASPSPRSSASTAASPEPAARTAASHDAAEADGVGVEVAAAPPRRTPRAGRGSRRVHPLELGPGRAARRKLPRPRRRGRPRAGPSSTACSRAGRSGWPRPGSCSANAGRSRPGARRRLPTRAAPRSHRGPCAGPREAVLRRTAVASLRFRLE